MNVDPALLWVVYLLGQIQGMVQLALIFHWIESVLFIPTVRPPGKIRGWLHGKLWRVVKWWRHWW